MAHLKIKRARLELSILLVLALVTTVVFWLTDLDHRLMNGFYQPSNPDNPWPIQRWWLVKPLYDYAFPFTVVAGVIAFLVYMLSHFHAYTSRFRRRALYVLLVIAIGPGVVVNLVVKDHWGRPRPVHVKEYGGEYDYVAPGRIGHSPDKSFVCGHCSVGYAFFVLYFLSQNHKAVYFALTLVLAWTMGFTRMTAGGHFVSDVLWSGYLVFLVAWALYYGWYLDLKWRREPKS